MTIKQNIFNLLFIILLLGCFILGIIGLLNIAKGVIQKKILPVLAGITMIALAGIIGYAILMCMFSTLFASHP